MFSNEQGLSNEEIKTRQQKFGLNILPEKPLPNNFALIAAQLKNPLVYVLLLAGTVTVAIKEFADAGIILLAVILNTILGFVQEKKATNALHALKRYITSQITVIRDGKRIAIETSQIVPGDIVILNQGTKIPADGKLTYINRLYIDESILTGESVSIKKNQDQDVFMGTTVSAGQAMMRVEKTGANTKMGEIALQIQEKEED